MSAGDLANAIAGAGTDLKELIAMPSVSGVDAHRGDLEECARTVARMLEKRGMPEAVAIGSEAAGPWLIAIRHAKPGRATVLLYAHYDVVPAGASGWSSNPFTPSERAGRLYGRGTADDKAGVAVHLAALEHCIANSDLGLVALLDGGEEVGSPGSELALHAVADQADPSLIVVADGDARDAARPYFTSSLRGYLDCMVEVRTLRETVHSGEFGGLFPDAVSVLARLLASLHDASGTVAVPGLIADDAVPRPNGAMTAVSAGVAVDGVSERFRGRLGEHLFHRSSASIIGINAPGIEGATRALAPTASALVSFRLSPEADPDDAYRAVEGYLKSVDAWGAEVTISRVGSSAGYAVSERAPLADRFSQAYAESWDAPVETVRSGGSIPFVAAAARVFPDAAIVITGLSDSRSNPHGADESVDLELWRRACQAEATAIEQLAMGG